MAEDKTEITKKVINEIMNQALLVEATFDDLKKNVEKTLAKIDFNRISKVYFTGCGDSYFAGVAVRYWFEKLTGMLCEPIEALEFSRYHVDFAPADSLLVSISNSGTVSRVIEATIKARKKGITTIAITKHPESPLAQSGEYLIEAIIPPMPSGAVGTRSYTASLLGAYLIALVVAKARGKITDEEYEKEADKIRQLSKTMQEVIESQSNDLLDLVNNNKIENNLVVVGGGPNYGTAMFGAAKVLEAVNVDAIPTYLEEWAHLQFHTVYEGKYTIVIAPKGRATGRAREQLIGIKDSSGSTICLSDDESLEEYSDFFIRMPEVDEALSPFLYCIPIEFIATYLSLKLGKSMRMRQNDWLKEVNFRQIFHSEIEE